MEMKKLLLVNALCLIALPALAADVAYPKNYRQWAHVKSLILEEGHPLFASFGGLHHIYANDKALEGYRSGRFPDGAVIVFDLLEAQKGGNAIAEGPRKVLGVMQKDRQRFKDTGGWGFEGFAQGDPNQRVVKDQAKEACFGCHAEQAGKTDYVFSQWRK
jgi:hypothetical protein